MLATAGRGDFTQPFGVRRFLSRRILVLVSLFLAVVFVFLWAGWLTLVAGVWSINGPLPRFDFYSFWSASSLALHGHAATAYDPRSIWLVQSRLPGDAALFSPWRNPPVFFFLVLPLSLLPLGPSLMAWGLATGTLALSAVRRMVPDRTLVTWLALVFPATMWNLIIGQNGLLTAGLFAWGILLLDRHPRIAGILFGLMVFKPQFFPLVLIALLASRRRTALISVLGCVAALSVASLVLFGVGSWEGFIDWARVSSDSIYVSHDALNKMQSISAMLLLAGVPALLAQAAQICTALACAAFVFWLWRGSAALEYQAAGLALASLLATPYSFHYDLTLLGLAVLWLALSFQRDGWGPLDAEVLLVGWLTPLLAVLSAGFLHFTFAPLIMLLLMAMITRRVRRQYPLPARVLHQQFLASGPQRVLDVGND